MEGIKRTLNDALENPNSKHFVLVNDTLAFLTILSIAALVLDTVPSLAPYHTLFLYIEYIAVAFFTVEYVVRVWITKKSLRYIFSFFGFVDLVSIFPTYISFMNLTALKSARVLRILRFLRILRIAKIARTQDKEKRRVFDVRVYFFSLIAAILLLGAFMYTVEGFRKEFMDIPHAMIWSAKVILGGIPQYSPATYWGELVIILTRFTGLLLFGLLINIIAGSLKWLIFGEKLKE